MTENRFINPETIPPQDLPLIVLSDFSSGIIQSLIKIRTKGYFSHSMVMHRPGFFASQGNMFSEAPLGRYTKDGNRLKFFKIIDLTKEERSILLDKIQKDLKAHWLRRWYDYPGIIGQALGWRWFNSPFRAFCSERVATWLRTLPRLSYFPEQPSPEELNRIMKAHPEHFEIYGLWDSDLAFCKEVKDAVSSDSGGFAVA